MKGFKSLYLNPRIRSGITYYFFIVMEMFRLINYTQDVNFLLSTFYKMVFSPRYKYNMRNALPRFANYHIMFLVNISKNMDIKYNTKYINIKDFFLKIL